MLRCSEIIKSFLLKNALALYAGGTVVCQHAGRGVVDVAARPCFVGHR